MFIFIRCQVYGLSVKILLLWLWLCYYLPSTIFTACPSILIFQFFLISLLSQKIQPYDDTLLIKRKLCIDCHFICLYEFSDSLFNKLQPPLYSITHRVKINALLQGVVARERMRRPLLRPGGLKG